MFMEVRQGLQLYDWHLGRSSTCFWMGWRQYGQQRWAPRLCCTHDWQKVCPHSKSKGMRTPVLYTDVHTPHSNAMVNCLVLSRGQGSLLLLLAFGPELQGPSPVNTVKVSSCVYMYDGDTQDRARQELRSLLPCYLLLVCRGSLRHSLSFFNISFVLLVCLIFAYSHSGCLLLVLVITYTLSTRGERSQPRSDVHNHLRQFVASTSTVRLLTHKTRHWG